MNYNIYCNIYNSCNIHTKQSLVEGKYFIDFYLCSCQLVSMSTAEQITKNYYY